MTPPAVLAQVPFPNWAWLSNPRTHERLAEYAMEHLVLTFAAVAAGLAVALPLAVLAVRHRRLQTPLLTATGVLYTVPALAMFIFLVPLFIALTGTGYGRATSVAGLAIYSLLILFRNTVAGLDGVPADVREAGEAMGYTRNQLLWRVELPVALPVLVAGVRIATVSTVGLVTITALIGQGGLGRLFITGYNRFDLTIALTGVVLATALATLIDWAMVLVQRRLLPWTARST
jgi:osmoprotectant transport system permease protein